MLSEAGSARSGFKIQLTVDSQNYRCCRAWTRTKNTHIQSVVCYQLHHAAIAQTIPAAGPWIKDGSFGPFRLSLAYPYFRVPRGWFPLARGFHAYDYVYAGFDWWSSTVRVGKAKWKPAWSHASRTIRWAAVVSRMNSFPSR